MARSHPRRTKNLGSQLNVLAGHTLAAIPCTTRSWESIYTLTIRTCPDTWSWVDDYINPVNGKDTCKHKDPLDVVITKKLLSGRLDLGDLTIKPMSETCPLLSHFEMARLRRLHATTSDNKSLGHDTVKGMADPHYPAL